MDSRKAWFGVIAAAWMAAGCAAAAPSRGGLAAPAEVKVPPIIVGAGLPTEAGEPYLDAPAGAATALSAPLHYLNCAWSAFWGGLAYALYFPGEFSEDMKAWVAKNCAGPYVVTPAELARVPAPFPVRPMRTPRTGTLPVEEVVRISAPR